MKKTLIILFTLLTTIPAFAQLTQKVRGRITDAESGQPLPGVTVLLLSNTQLSASSDTNGFFNIEGVSIGRQSLQFSRVAYETCTASEVLVISGKELELNVSLKESLHNLKEVTVRTTGKDRTRAKNEFAAVSARSFSVEETRRYAASLSDPARMVMNFPGVSNNGDMDNSIVVRGNSPKGVLWRLEGIEIPSPNHFGGLGTTGGPISMLNANMLGTSDFYTGAFAPEIGNALSGAFDLSFRNGNTEKYEHTVQLGALGMEIATEGPFRKGGRSSYLINYRYSTLAVLGRFLDLDGVQPNYQDASFKLHFPTKKSGTFDVFGLGGYNKAFRDAETDSSKWEDVGNWGYLQKSKTGIIGMSHQYFLGKDAYLKTVLSGSYEGVKGHEDTANAFNDFVPVRTAQTSFINTAYRLSLLYNQKLNARNTFRTGIIAQQLGFDLNYDFYDGQDKVWKKALESNGSTQFYQAYLQWKSRLTDRMTFIGGVHGSYLALNGKNSMEPRASLAYQLNNRSKATLSAGLHSKPDHLSTYLYRSAVTGKTNEDLDLQRAFHGVAAYETSLPGQLRLKAEAYYQHLYKIGVEADSASDFSMLNAESSYSLLSADKQLVSIGTGTNYGIDMSLERPFANQWYLMATTSLFKSTYTDYAGRTFNTRFDRGYQFNIICGKEFKLTSGGHRVLGVNGRLLTSGGQRESVLDLEASRLADKAVYVPGSSFSRRGDAYFRADMSLYYKINKKNSTHTLQLDVQNLTNRANYYYSYYDVRKDRIQRVNQLGIFPNISYRIDFHW